MRVAILGNSGSGKSTLARWLARRNAEILDLDTLAWAPGKIAVARDLATACADVESFCAAHPSWVIEGCYGRLVTATLEHSPFLVFLDPGREVCLANCRARPWEPHKYATPAEQESKLAFLLDWVAAYDTRDDDMSRVAHSAAFAGYGGRKLHVTWVPDAGFVLP